MTPSELQLKIDKIIDRSFEPTREQKITSILTIVSSLDFDSVLAHALKVTFHCDDIRGLQDEQLEQLFQIARTWRYQADNTGPQEQQRPVVVNFRSSDA
ncbi:MAG: hypothetical protein GY948_12090 [Alphaproteobacteria bacterium]|nr:hypothetical protein [Alphaproteobacteria bacterium]